MWSNVKAWIVSTYAVTKRGRQHLTGGEQEESRSSTRTSIGDAKKMDILPHTSVVGMETLAGVMETGTGGLASSRSQRTSQTPLC